MRNWSLALTGRHCLYAPEGVSISVSFGAVRLLLLLPLSVFVLHLAWRRRRRRRPGETGSHSDVLAVHAAVQELLWAAGSLLFLLGLLRRLLLAVAAGRFLTSFNHVGQSLLHALTCVERYLAVVHPVAYRGLRTARGARLRDVGVAGVWLLCAALAHHTNINNPDQQAAPFFGVLAVSLAVVSSCSLAVLRVLVRPGPGEGGGARVAQSKRRAFFTIAAILWAELLWLLGLLATSALFVRLPAGTGCTVQALGAWFGLPSCLVLPLLYLHRAGLTCGYHGNQRP